MGDIIESLSSKANMQQLQSNDLSPMQQTDLAASLMFELIKRMSKYAPITYGSIASNHCQNRFMGQTVGKPGLDDWGIVILQQLRRLTTEIGMDVSYLIPQPDEEGFAFQYGVNTIGAVHGHQAARPAGVKKWWSDATFGNQWASACDVLISAHFHHLAIEELGQRHDGNGSSSGFNALLATTVATGIGASQDRTAALAYSQWNLTSTHRLVVLSVNCKTNKGRTRWTLTY